MQEHAQPQAAYAVSGSVVQPELRPTAIADGALKDRVRTITYGGECCQLEGIGLKRQRDGGGSDNFWACTEEVRTEAGVKKQC